MSIDSLTSLFADLQSCEGGRRGNVVKSRNDDGGSAVRGGGYDARPLYVLLLREDVKVFGGVTAYKQLSFYKGHHLPRMALSKTFIPKICKL